MIKQKIWKQLNNGFLRGDEFRPATLNEKLAIAFLAGITAWLTIERIAWYFMGNLKVWY